MDDSTNFLKHLSDPSTWNGRQTITTSEESPQETSVTLGPPEGLLPQIVSGSDFPAQYNLNKRQWLIEGLFQRSDNILLTAPSKIGKSWFWANVATSIAAGLPFIGKDTAKGNVLILDLELRRDVAMDRLWSIALAMGLEKPPENLYLWSLARHCYDLDVIAEVLHSRLDELPDIDLLVVDPLYLFERESGFDENNAHCVTHLMVELEKLTARTGAALGLSHHYRKGSMGGENHIDRGSGSGAFSRYPDVLMTLSKHQADDCMIAEVTARNSKSPPPFCLQLETPLLKPRDDLDATQYWRSGGTATSTKEIEPKALLAMLPEDGLSRSEWLKASGSTEPSFAKALGVLRNSGQVKATNDGGTVIFNHKLKPSTTTDHD